MKSSLIALGLTLALNACGPKDLKFQVTIVTKVCGSDSSLDPFKQVSFLKVRVTAPDITKPLESVAASNGTAHDIKIPEVPAGKNRVIEVRGYQGDPRAGGQLISMGRSLPFEVLDVIPSGSDNAPTQVNIFLRDIGAITPVSGANDPTTCQTMKLPRAGHSATVLKDGRVYIAGGYQQDALGVRTATAETEIFDPGSGSFVSFHPITAAMGIQPLPRAFHTSTLLPSGQVLIWGGETYNGTAANVVSPSAILVIFDVEGDSKGNYYGAVKSRPSPPSIARTRHSAVLDANGKVLIVGGVSRDQASLVPVPQVEWFDPNTDGYSVVDGVMLPRDGASVAALQEGSFVAVAGGFDGTTMNTDVTFFRWTGTVFEVKDGPPVQLTAGRRGAAAAIVSQTNGLLLAGGYSDSAQMTPLQTSEIVRSDTNEVQTGATVPIGGDACAVTLSNGNVFMAGGRGFDGTNAKSLDTTAVLQMDASGNTQAGSTASLAVPRYQHTCTLLQDGTVLITGGLNEQGATQTVLNDAYIYQPPPTD